MWEKNTLWFDWAIAGFHYRIIIIIIIVHLPTRSPVRCRGAERHGHGGLLSFPSALETRWETTQGLIWVWLGTSMFNFDSTWDTKVLCLFRLQLHWIDCMLLDPTLGVKPRSSCGSQRAWAFQLAWRMRNTTRHCVDAFGVSIAQLQIILIYCDRWVSSTIGFVTAEENIRKQRHSQAMLAN